MACCLTVGGCPVPARASGVAVARRHRQVADARALSECVADTEHFRLRYQCSPYHSNIAFYPVIGRWSWPRTLSAAMTSPTSWTSWSADRPVRAGRRCRGATVRDAAVVASRGSLRSPQPVVAAATRADHCHFDRTIGGARPATAGTFPGGGCALDRPSNEALISEVIAAIAGAAVLTLITHRPEYTSPWSGQSHLTSLSLSHFSRAQSAQVVRTIAGGRFDVGTIEKIVERAGGIPSSRGAD